MKVKCVGTRGRDLPQKVLEVAGFPNSEFNITYGKQYTVYAMVIWRDVLNYLILSDESPSPSWLPADLFEVTEPTLPRTWSFQYFKSHTDPRISLLSAVWGYEELISNEDHYRALIEIEPQAIEVFNKRKEEIDA